MQHGVSASIGIDLEHRPRVGATRFCRAVHCSVRSERECALRVFAFTRVAGKAVQDPVVAAVFVEPVNGAANSSLRSKSRATQRGAARLNQTAKRETPVAARNSKGAQDGVATAVLLEFVNSPKVVAASILRHPVQRRVASLDEFSLRILPISNQSREIPYH